MDVMFDFQEAAGIVVGWIDSSVPNILGVLDQSWRVIQVSFSVQVKVCTRLADMRSNWPNNTDKLYDSQGFPRWIRKYHYTQNKGV